MKKLPLFFLIFPLLSIPCFAIPGDEPNLNIKSRQILSNINKEREELRRYKTSLKEYEKEIQEEEGNLSNIVDAQNNLSVIYQKFDEIIKDLNTLSPSNAIQSTPSVSLYEKIRQGMTYLTNPEILSKVGKLLADYNEYNIKAQEYEKVLSKNNSVDKLPPIVFKPELDGAIKLINKFPNGFPDAIAMWADLELAGLPIPQNVNDHFSKETIDEFYIRRSIPSVMKEVYENPFGNIINKLSQRAAKIASSLDSPYTQESKEYIQKIITNSKNRQEATLKKILEIDEHIKALAKEYEQAEAELKEKEIAIAEKKASEELSKFREEQAKEQNSLTSRLKRYFSKFFR
jgi:hypothetical protein